LGKKGLGMSIKVCIPTLKAVEELKQCINSVLGSSISCNIFIVDNGGIVRELRDSIVTHKPVTNLGVAGSWNYFIDNVPDVRLITNDDIIFDLYAVEQMLVTLAHNRREGISNIVSPENLGSPFSCFLLPTEVIEKVGRFDEWISPKYAYFEDNDYSYRMSKVGIGISKAEKAFVIHGGSSTIRHFDKQKEKEHHDRFRLARNHYIKKWGGEPGQELFETPFNR
jgi:hypothetical protein